MLFSVFKLLLELLFKLCRLEGTRLKVSSPSLAGTGSGSEEASEIASDIAVSMFTECARRCAHSCDLSLLLINYFTESFPLPAAEAGSSWGPFSTKP